MRLNFWFLQLLFVLMRSRGSADRSWMTPVWKGFLSLGAIAAPVKLAAAARSERIDLHQLHADCSGRMKQQLVCAACGDKVVDRADIVKGYEIEKNSYLTFSAQELKAIEPEASNTIVVDRFVKLTEVDPVYFDAAYYLIPEGAGTAACGLLATTMEEMDLAAIGRLVIHQREHTVLIRSSARIVIVHTLHSENEIRQVDALNLNTFTDEERRTSARLLKALTRPFVPPAQDQYQRQLRSMIDSRKARPQDLVTALQRSISKKKRPRKAA